MVVKKLLATFLLSAIFLAIPAAAAQASVMSFGGRVAAIVPCAGGMFWVTIISARGATPGIPEFYIWTPATITYFSGLPHILGGSLLGTADVPFVCFIGGGFFSSPIPLYGMRMTTLGSSPLVDTPLTTVMTGV